MPIFDSSDEFFYTILEEYKRTSNFNNSRIRQDLTKEGATSSDYHGREVYELIQNAEDQESEYVEITLDTLNRVLTVANGGRRCQPFSEEGFCSIMMADMSPKFVSKRTYIGNKGLGFRSLLNWSDKISIESSGVRCTFSREISRKYWDIIKSSLNSEELVSLHEQFANKFPHKCPVAMLAIPEVENICQGNHSASIVIQYRDDSLDSIKSQLESLSGKVLLFLKNIRRITIRTTDTGDVKEIARSNFSKVTDKISSLTTSDPAHPDGQTWTLYRNEGIHDSNKKYEVAIAYDDSSKESGHYLYSFFPTRLHLDTPYVLHATFDLNSSRNSINESADNSTMQRHIADAIIEFSEYLASLDKSCRNGWTYYRFLSIPHDRLPVTADLLQNRRNHSRIFPTISDGYHHLADTLHYSEKIAQFITENSFLSLNSLSTHLRCGFAEYGIEKMPCDSRLHEASTLLSDELLSFPLNLRAKYLVAVSDVHGCHDIKLLVDHDNRIIDGAAYVNVGESIPYLPETLKISYVSDALIQELLSEFELDGDKFRRQLVAQLKYCVDIHELNITETRSRIISFVNKPMTQADFRQLMFALFVRIEKSPANSNDICQLFTNPRFKVLAADGSKHFPSELVLYGKSTGYPDKWRLYGTLSQWSGWFGDLRNANLPHDTSIQTDTDTIRNFFLTYVGISISVPMLYVPLTDKANEYIAAHSKARHNLNLNYDCFYSNTLEYRNSQSYYNRFKPIDPDFITYLADSGKSLSEIITLIHSDPKAVGELYGHTLYYQYRTPKPENVDINYSLYCLRRHEVFRPLANYIVSERLSLIPDESTEKQLNSLAENPDTSHFLIRLGANNRLSDLSVESLYDVLNSLPDRNLKTGIQKIYKLLREAIISVRDRDKDAFKRCADDFARHGRVYARKNNTTEIIPACEAYYWDNDQLPHSILASKHKLEIGNRVGEDSVKSIFGVKLAKDISIRITDHDIDRTLTEALVRHLRERTRFIIAYRLREIKTDKDRRNITKPLKNIKFSICTRCNYENDGLTEKLSEGDMISASNEFYVLSGNHTSINQALKNPVFCENITEAICISLKVTSSEMANCFRRILKDTIEENIYVSQKEISPDEWACTDRAIGLSETEKLLWTEVSRLHGYTIDIDSLAYVGKKHKPEILRQSIPGIILPDNTGEISDLSPEDFYRMLLSLNISDAAFLPISHLQAYYSSWFDRRRTDYENSYFRLVYETSTDPYRYRNMCQRFKSQDWYTAEIKSISSKVVGQSELETIFASLVFTEFGVIVDTDIKPHTDFVPQIKSEYQKILNDNNLDNIHIDQHILALALFDGYTEIFEREIKPYINRIAPSDNGESDITLKIFQGKALNKLPVRSATAGGSGNAGKGYKHEMTKVITGRNAEKAVLKALKADNQYHNIKGVSRNLDPINGNDKLHYDISYSLAGSDTTRYLEVKFMSTDSILMSTDEYDFALRNKNVYDFAIVHNNEIAIIQTPFLASADSPALTADTETYRITMQIKAADIPST